MSIEDLARHGEQIEKLVEELTALRAWKEKARPLLGDFHNMIFRHDDKDYYKRRIEILTELLGGSDE